MITPISLQPQPASLAQPPAPRLKLQRFQFPNYDLAFCVREVVYLKLIDFDQNRDQQFQQQQIKTFLTNVLHEDSQQIHYFVKNVFRYDTNNDGVIEYDQLVNFCMEQHFGEIAIQRLHKKKTYRRGQQRVMDQGEFILTIEYALKFVAVAPKKEELRTIFACLDLDKDGVISYEDYFRFLKEYFGSKSKAAGLVNKLSVLEELRHSLEGEEPQLNIVKKYSKYDGKDNINTSGQNGKNQTNGLNNISNISTNIIDRKGKPVIPAPKLQLTILNKHQRQNTKDFSLTQDQIVLAERIARLVYLQVKVALVYYDNDQDLHLLWPNLQLFMKENLKYEQNQLLQSGRRHNNGQKDRGYSYGQASRIVISEHLTKIFKDQREKQFTEGQFCQISESICSIANNTPLRLKYEALFDSRCEKEQKMLGSDIQQLYSYIFANYPKEEK